MNEWTKFDDIAVELETDNQFHETCNQLISRGGKMPKLPTFDKVKFSAFGAFVGQALGFAAMQGYDFRGDVNSVLDWVVGAGGLLAGAFGAFVAGYQKTENAVEVSPK